MDYNVFKIVSGIGIGIGAIAMISDHQFMGMGIMFFGVMLGCSLDSQMRSDADGASSYKSTKETSEFKDDFEEYQFWKINKK